MGQSLTAGRMSKNHQRLNDTAKLNLVSLMDIFTILVFFLLLNSGDAEVLQSSKHIKLPDSVSEQIPQENVVVTISGSALLVGGRQVATVEEILATDSGSTIKGLEEELVYLASKRPNKTERELEFGRGVTIMGDHTIPYEILKVVMGTCAKVDYRNISLAVSKVSGNKPAAEKTGG